MVVVTVLNVEVINLQLTVFFSKSECKKENVKHLYEEKSEKFVLL